MPQVARERHGPCSLLPRRLCLQAREAFHLPQQQTSPGLSVVEVDEGQRQTIPARTLVGDLERALKVYPAFPRSRAISSLTTGAVRLAGCLSALRSTFMLALPQPARLVGHRHRQLVELSRGDTRDLSWAPYNYAKAATPVTSAQI